MAATLLIPASLACRGDLKYSGVHHIRHLKIKNDILRSIGSHSSKFQACSRCQTVCASAPCSPHKRLIILAAGMVRQRHALLVGQFFSVWAPALSITTRPMRRVATQSKVFYVGFQAEAAALWWSKGQEMSPKKGAYSRCSSLGDRVSKGLKQKIMAEKSCSMVDFEFRRFQVLAWFGAVRFYVLYTRSNIPSIIPIASGK